MNTKFDGVVIVAKMLHIQSLWRVRCSYDVANSKLNDVVVVP